MPAMDWNDLLQRLNKADGPDSSVDELLGVAVPGNGPHPTASAESARAWAAAVLPGWHAHVGFDASGVMPYAAFSRDDHHVEASAATVPLAILRAAVAVLAGDFPQ